jgi:hypothetical protein
MMVLPTTKETRMNTLAKFTALGLGLTLGVGAIMACSEVDNTVSTPAPALETTPAPEAEIEEAPVVEVPVETHAPTPDLEPEPVVEPTTIPVPEPTLAPAPETKAVTSDDGTVWDCDTDSCSLPADTPPIEDEPVTTPPDVLDMSSGGAVTCGPDARMAEDYNPAMGGWWYYCEPALVG